MMVSSGTRGPTPDLRGVDPETCMIVFKNHWAQVLRILEKYEPSRSGSRLASGPISGDEASAVQNYVEHMLFLLTEEECAVGGATGPILEFVLLENVMERLFVWSLRRDFTTAAKLEQLRMYETLVTRARQPLLHHQPVLRPLALLLSSCGCGSAAVEVELVRLLHRLCRTLAHDDITLKLFLFHSGRDQGAADFLLFSLLLPFVHRDGALGAQARHALALIVASSERDVTVADYITQNTFFCPVLATGLSALYSWLPATLEVHSEGWHRLEEADWVKVPALVQFLNSLHFCSTVCKVAHHTVRNQLLGYVYSGFLVPVLAPALHKSTLEEAMTTTAYLELFLRQISEPGLLQTFLVFILKHRHDNVSILDTLVSRINTPFQLGTVSLALFHTLIGLYCEDVMLQLILRYLIPCSHLQRNGRRRLREPDRYSSSAAAFLSLTPSFLMDRPSTSPTLPPKPDYILWSKVTERLLIGINPPDLFQDVAPSGNSEPLVYQNYLQYLRAARSMVSTSVWACQVWSAPYDGLNPAPDHHRGKEEESEDKDKDEDGCPPLTTPPLRPPTPHRTSSSRTPELEWDDSYDAAPDANRNVRKPECQPPQRVQEMRKSAIMLIRGSYMEESEFQDDILVYDLVAQRDARNDQLASLRSRGDAAMLNQPNTELQTNTPDEGSAHDHRNQSAVSGELLFSPDASDASSAQRSGQDFLPRCRQLIDGETESMLGEDRDHFQRLTALLYGKEPEIDFNSVCVDDEDDDEDRQRAGDEEKPVPFTGPFISVLLSRLENMLENSAEVNLLVTGILARMAAYPQPLLRCFLLSTRAVFQPSVRSLHQVLVSLGCQIEQHAGSRPEFAQMVRDAAQYLLLREEASKDRDRDFLQENALGWVHDGHVFGRLPKSIPPCPNIPPRSRNGAFAAFLYAEFLKELAAIAQEHSIRPDDLMED